MSENKNGAGFYTGLFLGSIAGLTMGVLFAPKSGEETRSIISDKTSDWKEKAEEVQGEVIDCGHFLPEEAPQKVASNLIEFFKQVD